MYADLNDFLHSIGFNSKTTPPGVLSFPSMMAKDEKALLYALARFYYRGTGIIVDAGLFLGASTNAFGAGLKDNPGVMAWVKRMSLKPIHAYEVAIWDSAGFDKYLAAPEVQRALNGACYRNGENYFPLLERLLEPHRDLIDFRIGDIEKEARADSGIEIAFYDCLKNYERDLAAFNAFAPHYIAGHTVVIQQDFFYEDALDNKIRQEFLSPYFTFLGGVANSAVFRADKEIPREYFQTDPLLSLSVDEKIRLLESAANRIPRSAYQLYTAMGVVNLMIRNNRIAEADAYLANIEKVIQTTSLPQRAADVAASMREQIANRSGKA